MLDPMAAVGLVTHHSEAGRAVLGTAFAFRHPSAFLTAAHCIGDLPSHDLRIVTFADGNETTACVREVWRHPNADIAVVRIDQASDRVTPFWNFVSNYAWGEEFMAFGYPEDVFGPTRVVTPRLFRGHFQRIYSHRSHAGYAYRAAEMSIGAPAGLSGGPLFRPGAPVMVTGLVTENLESTTVLHSVEERSEDGSMLRERYQRVITYGVGLLLDGVGDWLDQLVAPRVHAG